MSRTPNRSYPYPDPGQTYSLTTDLAELAKAIDSDMSGVESSVAPAVAINDLTDVDTSTSPAVDGQALVYSTADGTWKPGTMSVTNAGATELNGLSDVDTVTVAPLDAQVLGYDGAAARWAPVDLPTTVTALDGLSDVDLATTPPAEGEILIRRGTQFVPEPLPVIPAILDSLTDVTAGSPTGGQVLTYNATTGQWEPAVPTGGTGGGATTLDELSDVDLTTDPAMDGEVLVKRGAQWVPEPVAAGGTSSPTSLDALTDVDTTTSAPAVGQSLVWDGTNWVPGTVSGGTGETASFVIIDNGGVVPAGTPEGTLVFERTA